MDKEKTTEEILLGLSVLNLPKVAEIENIIRNNSFDEKAEILHVVAERVKAQQFNDF